MKTLFTLFILVILLHSSNAQIMVGESEHFEFYTDFTDETDYWIEIKDDLEKNYIKYCGHWNIPGLEDFIDNQRKTKVYYTEKENISNKGDDNILDIKSGYFDRDNYSMFLSPLDTPEKIDYYESLKGLAVNTFAGYAVRHRVLRDGWEDYLPPYFIEGFGLYEQGFRPNRDSVISYLENNPQSLSHDIFSAFSKINNSSEKDILTAHIQWCALFCGYREIYWSYGNIPDTEKKFFYYFYTAPDDIQIKKYGESEYFDIYCSSRDTMFIDSFKVWLENTRDFYVDSYEMEINVRYPLLVMYDEQTGMDLTGYDNFNGGAGSICISPHNFFGGFDGYKWLLGHELGHVFNSLMYYKFPFGFYHEGMANFTGFMLAGGDHTEDRWKIEYVFHYYKSEYGRDPNLEEIIDNPDEGKPGLEWGIDCYYFGFEFFWFIKETEGYLKIKDFFAQGLDFSVFDQSYKELEEKYIQRLKLYQNLTPKDSLIPLPFQETFTDFSNGWTKPSYINPDNWQIDDGGTNNCARFYTSSDKNEPIESWLISPALDTKDMEQVSLSFDFARYGEGIEVDVFYTDKFEGYTDSSNWTSLKSIEMPIDWGTSNTGEITINNPSDTLFIGLRMKSTGEQHQQLYIDNFEVDGTVTNLNLIASKESSLSVNPNPSTSESVISFQTKNSRNLNLSVFDIHGRKITTILNKNLPAGSYNYSLGKNIPSDGVYFLRLKTQEGISTQKFVFKK